MSPTMRFCRRKSSETAALYRAYAVFVSDATGPEMMSGVRASSIRTVPAIVVGACVGIGSAAWFTLLARTIAKLPRDGWVARWLPTISLALLATLAVGGVIRAFVVS
jgi:hypothetical protein